MQLVTLPQPLLGEKILRGRFARAANGVGYLSAHSQPQQHYT